MQRWDLGVGSAAVIASLLMGVPSTLAECVVTSAPPETLSINLPAFGPNSSHGVDYVEERELCVASGTLDDSRGEGCGYAVAPPTTPPPYLWGWQFGEGSWHYRETNGLPGLQTDSTKGAIYENPGCGFLGVVPCVLFYDQVGDETCGAGPDRLVL